MLNASFLFSNLTNRTLDDMKNICVYPNKKGKKNEHSHKITERGVCF